LGGGHSIRFLFEKGIAADESKKPYLGKGERVSTVSISREYLMHGKKGDGGGEIGREGFFRALSM